MGTSDVHRPLPVPRLSPEAASALIRAIRTCRVIDRNRFAAIDARMSPDRLALPTPLALLLRK